MSSMRLRHGLLALACLATTARSQAACPAIPVAREVVYQQPVYISTSILSNMTFFPIPQAAVTITDAPTNLDGITTVVWTGTQTISNSASQSYLTSTAHYSPSPTPTPADELFVLLVSDDRHNNKKKRQAGGIYIGGNGQVTNDCTMSPVYTVKNGGLTSTVNGTAYTYSTSAGVSVAQFVPSTIPGDITTTFAIGGNGALSWINPSFYNGQASFCSTQNGTVYAIFAYGAQPDGCFFIQLSLFSVSSCQAISFATISGPSGPPGSPGPSGPTGVSGTPGIAGPSGPSGPSGATGVSGAVGAAGSVGATGSPGIAGPSGPSGATGVSGAIGATGSPGASGAVGATGSPGIAGPSGPSGPSGATGVSGAVGATGSPGASGAVGATGSPGIAGPSGPSGATGVSGAIGATGSLGASGAVGATGSPGIAGPSGPSGATGVAGPSGPSGASGLPGASASPGILYAYLGCYVQTGTSTGTTGRALPDYKDTYTSTVNSRCSTTCLSQGYIFFGTINQSTTGATCWCGNSITYVTLAAGLLGANSVTGPAGENNCYQCNGAALPGGVTGECGKDSVSTIAIYARSF